MADLREVRTDAAPAAIGPYSQAIVSGGWVFTAGQIALDPATGELIDGDAAAQTERALENLKEVLAAAGADMSAVVKTTVYLADLGDYAVMNDVYDRYFQPPYPARAAVQVARLPKDCRIEIDAVARIDG